MDGEINNKNQKESNEYNKITMMVIVFMSEKLLEESWTIPTTWEELVKWNLTNNQMFHH